MSQIRSVQKWFESTFRPGGFWFNIFFILLVAFVVVAGTYFTLDNWDWLQGNIAPTESNSTTLRNIGLLIGGAIALVFALWRGIVAGHQADTARRQMEVTQSQVELTQDQVGIAQQGLLNERYQRGAEMFGSETIAVRMGGIYALRNLAQEHPSQYHIQIMDLFCAFARHPTNDEDVELHPEKYGQRNKQTPVLRADVQLVMQAIGSRGSGSIGYSLERGQGYRLYLRDADLSYLQLRYPDLSYAWLTNANLSNTRLRQANLSDTRLRQANLSDADMSGANLRNANLSDANLSGARLLGVRGLTQAQLDEARANPFNPPQLDGLSDAETGEPLQWRGKSLYDD